MRSLVLSPAAVISRPLEMLVTLSARFWARPRHNWLIAASRRIRAVT